MLKFEGKFKVGDIIKAYDFEPMSDRPDSFILGKVVEEKNDEHGFAAYKVIQIKHVVFGNELTEDANTEAWIPHQVSFMEYDNRIEKVA